MKTRGLALIALTAVSLLLALPAAGQAGPTKLWGGAGFNDLGSSYGLLSVRNGQVKIKKVQLILACTDAEDGTESDRAFWALFNTNTPLRQNRFTREFTYYAGGRIGLVRTNGRLNSNRTGWMRVDVTARAYGERGETVERCQGATRINLRRSP